MKKKILIVSDSLRIGGIQTSLKNFIKTLPKEKFDITLFLFNEEGLENNLIDSNVKIKLGSKLLRVVSCSSEYAKKKGKLFYIVRKLYALLCKIFTSNVMYNLVFTFEKKLKGYDVVLSYSNNISNKSVYFGYNLFSIKKVEALEKISYIHIDYNKIHSKYIDSEYKKFNQIWLVSKFTKETFLKYNPSLEYKCKVIYNFIDIEKLNNIKKNPYKNNKFHIVTTGRLDENKSQIDAIEICKKLKNDKLDFDWYLLGDGPDRTKLQKLIKENNLSDNLYLCGNVDNVNEYLAYSNLFVSLSKSESYGLAIVESLLLNCVTISRNIDVISEIIENGKNGIYCELDEMYSYIKKLIINKAFYNKYKKNTKANYDYSKNLDNVIEALNGGM